jgi:hypothetical protein
MMNILRLEIAFHSSGQFEFTSRTDNGYGWWFNKLFKGKLCLLYGEVEEDEK